MKSVSIFIRAHNEAEALAVTLAALRSQSRPADEVIVLDNESTDDTVRISQGSGAQVAHIGREEFSYGRALNRCLTETKGDIVVFLSAHSPPEDCRWLSNLVAPLMRGEAEATFGRQIPVRRVNCLEEWFLYRTFPAKPRRWMQRLGLQSISFSNANAAVSRSALEREPFREDLEFAEDVEWSKRIHRMGMRVVYVPAAAVFHSHPFELGAMERRMESVGRAMGRQGQGGAYLNPLLFPGIALGTLAVDFSYCCLRGYWTFISTIPRYRLEYFRGLRRGLRAAARARDSTALSSSKE